MNPHILKVFPLALSLLATPPLAQILTPTAVDSLVVTEDLMVRRDAPPASTGDSLLRDESGDVHYIVDLHRGSEAAFEGRGLAPPDDGFASWHKTPARHLVRQVEQDFGVRATSISSWAGLGFTAYLSPEEVERLRRDSRVERITPDAIAVLSGPLWINNFETEMKTWGKRAVAENSVASTGGVRVYVLDAGVGNHTDLNVVQRVWPAGADAPGGLVGCYPHATHVAGIIGARANGSGVVGVHPGASIVSVSVLTAMNLNASLSCNLGGTNPATHIRAAAINSALDWVMQDITTRGQVGIVNLSLNAPENSIPTTNYYAATGSVGSRMKTLATSVGTYKGAFIAQSAGNFFQSACNHAYATSTSNPTPSPSDGIMVVGGIDDRGQPATPMHCVGSSCVGGFRNTGAQTQPGSNHGACVEAWAPSTNIRSTFAPDPQSGTTTHNTYALLSGTSMAAPHVAGLAAHLAQTMGLTTPSAIESAVRGTLVSLGSSDVGGQPLRLPTLNAPSKPAQVRAELAIRGPADGLFTFRPEHVGTTFTTQQVEGAGYYALSFDAVGLTSSGCRVDIADFTIPAYPSMSLFATVYGKTLWGHPNATSLPYFYTQPGSLVSYRFYAQCDASHSVGLYITP